MSNDANMKYLSPIAYIPQSMKGKEIVFLSPAEMMNENGFPRHFPECEMLSPIWDSGDKIRGAFEYLENSLEYLMPQIGMALNKIHRVNYPLFFWELPQGGWLVHYLSALYDRYLRLLKAIELYGMESITLLAADVAIYPTSNFNSFIDTYSVNPTTTSALYGAVADSLGIKVQRFDYEDGGETTKALVPSGINLPSAEMFRKLKRKIFDEYAYGAYFYLRRGNDLLIDRHNLTAKDVFHITGSIKATLFQSQKVIPKPEYVDRNALLNITGRDEFEKIAIKLLPNLTPKYLLEDFNSYLTTASRFGNYKAYFSANGWYSNIVMCYAASLGRINKAKLIGWQHGGGYGQYHRTLIEYIERKTTDYYITWGWKDLKYKGAELLALSQPNLSLNMNRHKQTNQTAIWITVSIPKHVFRIQPYPCMADLLPLYLKNKRLFASSLNIQVRNNVVYRPYHYDYGWLNIETKMIKKVSGIKIEYSRDFKSLIKGVKLYICDYMGTGYMEALATNTPTVLFWDKELNCEREEAKPYFDELRRAEILFSDPVDAALHVNKIWDDVQVWWNGPIVQNARIKFMEAHCRSDKHWIRYWKEAFKRFEITRADNDK